MTVSSAVVIFEGAPGLHDVGLDYRNVFSGWPLVRGGRFDCISVIATEPTEC